MIELQCRCGKTIKLPDSFTGKGGKCAQCKSILRLVMVRVPGSADASTPKFDASLIITAGPKRQGEQLFLGGAGTLNLATLTGKNVMLTRATSAQAWKILDPQNAAGASVNDQPTAVCELDGGENLRVGDYEFQFVSFAPSKKLAPAPAPPPIDELPTLEEDPPEIAVAAPSNQAPPTKPPAADGPEDLYDFAQPDPPKTKRISQPTAQWVPPRSKYRTPATPTIAMIHEAPSDRNGPVCPSCDDRLSSNSRICIPCGIYVNSGRPLVTSQGLDEDQMAISTAYIVRILSWFMFFSILPLASEAYGRRKPYAMWITMAVTCLISIIMWFLPLESPPLRNAMMWTGAITQEQITLRLLTSEESDPRVAAFVKKTEELESKVPADQLALTAYNALDEDQRLFGSFHWYQPITCMFLHAGFLHLAGNMIFLYVFGGRVNALVGNALFAPLYLVLGVVSSMVDYFATMHGMLIPTLGASGAIMGLAGMYFVFFPVQKVLMVIWLRILLYFVSWKVFRMRGFWLLVLWVGLNDVLPTVLKSRDHVGHWAHLGGFMGGAVLALALLASRQIHAHGADILSVALGKYAWPILGKPSRLMNANPSAPAALAAM